ncbi:MAG: hypothetical protein IT299_02880 [Dehalococcoidia bacterium]|nr:hypothetical protein [Dehalococcoidia bacterium]
MNEHAPPDAPRNTSLLGRARRAALLDAALYREVAADPAATGQAFILVTVIGVIGSLAAVSAGMEIAVASALLAPVAWLVTAGLAQLIGTRVMGAPREGAWERAARTLGFAHAPAVAGALALLPYVGVVVLVVLTAWRIAAMVVALRAAFELSLPQAIVTLVLSFVTLGAVTVALTAVSASMVG